VLSEGLPRQTVSQPCGKRCRQEGATEAGVRERAPSPAGLKHAWQWRSLAGNWRTESPAKQQQGWGTSARPRRPEEVGRSQRAAAVGAALWDQAGWRPDIRPTPDPGAPGNQETSANRGARRSMEAELLRKLGLPTRSEAAGAATLRDRGTGYGEP